MAASRASLALALLAILASANAVEHGSLPRLAQFGVALREQAAKAAGQVRGRKLAACDNAAATYTPPAGCEALMEGIAEGFNNATIGMDGDYTDSTDTFECPPLTGDPSESMFGTTEFTEAEQVAVCSCGGHINDVMKDLSIRATCLVIQGLGAAFGASPDQLDQMNREMDSALGVMGEQMDACNYCSELNTMCEPANFDSTNATFSVSGCNGNADITTGGSSSSSIEHGSMFLAGALALVAAAGRW